MRLLQPWQRTTINASAGLGALVGPTVGTSLWRMSHRNNLALIDAKDAEFYQRIAKNRVDASLQSPTSPIPDYYGMPELFHLSPPIEGSPPGEKIGSVHQYRQVSSHFLRRRARLIRLPVVEGSGQV